MEAKPIKDEKGSIAKAYKTLPQELHDDFLKALAELEDNECHRKRQFPHTRLHKLEGTKKDIFRADINKTSGWRIHVQYGKNNYLEICDILTGKEHDDATRIVKERKGRYR